MAFDPLDLDTLTYSGIELRRAAVLGVQGDGTAAGARSGVRPGDPGLTTTLSGSTISVSPGAAWVSYTGQGVYRAALSTAWSGTLTAAHATLPRVDLVYLRVWDTDVDAGGLRTADVVYLAGTAASTPTAPTPAGTQIYLPLATISVPASGSGSPFVSLAVRPTAVAPGGINPSATTSGVYAGQYRDNGASLERYDGTAWSRVTPYQPVSNVQVSQPPFDTLNTYVDFLSASWAPLSVTVPPSGIVRVTIGAEVRNTNNTSSTCYLTWRISGAATVSASNANYLVTSGQWLAASRVRICTGLPAGGSITVTPQWRISSGSSSTASIAGGQLIVEPLP